MNYLKNHPFKIKADFESSLVLTFAIPKDQLLQYLPDCLELDVFEDKWAFLAVALVQTKNLRPNFLPTFLGNDFFLVGYRIFVKYKNKAGKRLRGLYIIKSETDKSKMEFFGNIFTHYNYTTTDILKIENNKTTKIYSEKSKFDISIENINNQVSIPKDSPFLSWKEARRFSGPLPFTFTYLEEEKSVLIIEGVRKNWQPKPVLIKTYNFEFLNNLKFKNIVLASSFEIKDVSYFWKKGKIEKWK